jgi:DNA-binding NarL/FixJ family response regulator
MKVDVSGVNSSVQALGKYGKEIDEKHRDRLKNAAEDVARLVDTLAEIWESLGLSGREAEVAAYKQLGFTNRAAAYMLDLSPNTVNEYDRRAKEKVQTARQLVHRADRTEAFVKDWVCPNCREGIRRSHGNIELTDSSITYSCRKCWEDYERAVVE